MPDLNLSDAIKNRRETKQKEEQERLVLWQRKKKEANERKIKPQKDFNYAVALLERTLKDSKHISGEHRTALNNFITKSKRIVSRCDLNEQHHRKRMKELTSLITSANTLLNGGKIKDIEGSALDVIDIEMNSNSFFDQEINRIKIGIATTVACIFLATATIVLLSVGITTMNPPLLFFGLIALVVAFGTGAVACDLTFSPGRLSDETTEIMRPYFTKKENIFSNTSSKEGNSDEEPDKNAEQLQTMRL